MGEGRIDNCAAPDALRHIYVHIPFCARICPYCAFYKERADPAQATHFCGALLAEFDSCYARTKRKMQEKRTDPVFPVDPSLGDSASTRQLGR